METTKQAPRETRFTTTAIYFSGGICGTMWMPAAKAGKPFRQDARSVWGFWNKGDTFRDALNGILTREGGDFQDARFTSDSYFRIERRKVESAGVYTIHVFEREISELPDCADLVDADAFVSDFMGEDY